MVSNKNDRRQQGKESHPRFYLVLIFVFILSPIIIITSGLLVVLLTLSSLDRHIIPHSFSLSLPIIIRLVSDFNRVLGRGRVSFFFVSG